MLPQWQVALAPSCAWCATDRARVARCTRPWSRDHDVSRPASTFSKEQNVTRSSNNFLVASIRPPRLRVLETPRRRRFTPSPDRSSVWARHTSLPAATPGGAASLTVPVNSRRPRMNRVVVPRRRIPLVLVGTLLSVAAVAWGTEARNPATPSATPAASRSRPSRRRRRSSSTEADDQARSPPPRRRRSAPRSPRSRPKP